MSVRIVDADRGVVEVTPKRKKVAIVGFADSTRGDAPFADQDWEMWTLNQVYRHVPRWTSPELQDRNLYPIRHFEIHTRETFLADTVRDTNYLKWLQECPVPLYMIDRHPDIPMSVRFPIEKIILEYGRDYFQSTIAYQFALALYEGFEEIGIWGVDLIVGDEYFYQKANLEWWIGLAHGRGVTTTIPQKSALLKQTYRYGYQVEPDLGPLKMSYMTTRMKQYQQKHNELLTQVNALEGAMQDLEHWMHYLDLAKKGGTILADSGTGS